MAIIASTGKRRNFKEALWRVANRCWWGEDATGIEQVPDVLSGEFVQSVNAAGTGVVSLIGSNASDQVVLGPNGDVISTRTHFAYVLDAATAVTRTGLTARVAFQVTDVAIVFGTASASGTFSIEKLTGTTAPGSGTTMLTGTISTAGTANTVLVGTLTATVATLQLAVGDRIGFVFTGTETGLVGLNIMLSLKRL